MFSTKYGKPLPRPPFHDDTAVSDNCRRGAGGNTSDIRGGRSARGRGDRNGIGKHTLAHTEVNHHDDDEPVTQVEREEINNDQWLMEDKEDYDEPWSSGDEYDRPSEGYEDLIPRPPTSSRTRLPRAGSLDREVRPTPSKSIQLRLLHPDDAVDIQNWFMPSFGTTTVHIGVSMNQGEREKRSDGVGHEYHPQSSSYINSQYNQDEEGSRSMIADVNIGDVSEINISLRSAPFSCNPSIKSHHLQKVEPPHNQASPPRLRRDSPPTDPSLRSYPPVSPVGHALSRCIPAGHAMSRCPAGLSCKHEPTVTPEAVGSSPVIRKKTFDHFPQGQTIPQPFHGSCRDESLSSYRWFFGDIERKQSERLVKNIAQDGTFVVRRSKRGGDLNPYAITMYAERRVYNLLVRLRPDGLYALGVEKHDENVFDDLPALISFHKNNPIQLLGHHVTTDSSDVIRYVRLSTSPPALSQGFAGEAA